VSSVDNNRRWTHDIAWSSGPDVESERRDVSRWNWWHISVYRSYQKFA
jgi:hypothetical protein